MFRQVVQKHSKERRDSKSLFDSILCQQHLCQKLPKSVDVPWSYSVQHQCCLFETQCIMSIVISALCVYCTLLSAVQYMPWKFCSSVCFSTTLTYWVETALHIVKQCSTQHRHSRFLKSVIVLIFHSVTSSETSSQGDLWIIHNYPMILQCFANITKYNIVILEHQHKVMHVLLPSPMSLTSCHSYYRPIILRFIQW